MKRHAEREARSAPDRGQAVFHRLQSVDAADGYKQVTREEQHTVAQACGKRAAARFHILGHVPEQKLSALEPFVGRSGLICTRAETHSKLNRKEHSTTKVTLQGVEAAGPYFKRMG